MRFERISFNPDQMTGVPCIRGLRMPVVTVAGLVEAGMSEDEILLDYPSLERADIAEAVRYVAAHGIDLYASAW